MSLLRFFRRHTEDADLAREIEAHIAHEADENRARAQSEDEALRHAYLKFGNPQRVREDVWQWNTLGLLESVLRDLRCTVRTLNRTPAFALVAIVVMGLGIGANTALFSIVHSVLLQPLPFHQPDRLMMLYEESMDGKNPLSIVAPGIFKAWQQNRSFESMALFFPRDELNLSGGGGYLPERINAAACSWNLFSTLGARPAYGRTFAPSDDTVKSSGTVILSWALWRRRFGGDPAVIGKDILLDDKPRTVVGIMPSWFSYPDTTTQVWVPVYPEAPPGYMEILDSHTFHVVGRLKPGVTQGEAATELSVIERRIHDANPTKIIGKAATIRPLLEDLVGDYKRPLIVLLFATGCVLLIASLNFANLLVARSAVRRREVAIRSALGGSTLRLLREQLAESTLVTAAAGLLGLALTRLALQWVVRMRQDMARVNAIHMDSTVLLFAVGITFLTGALAGLVAAVPAIRGNMITALQESARLHGGGQSRAKLRKALLSAEVGLTVILLIAAGLLLKSYAQLRSVDLGCVTKSMLTMRLSLPDSRYKEPVQQVEFMQQLLTRVRALPGAESAGLVTVLPGAGYGSFTLFSIQEHPPLPVGQFQFAMFRRADPGYFAAMGIPLLRGRTFTDSERLDNSTAVVLNQEFVRKFFVPGEDPLGKHLTVSVGKRSQTQPYQRHEYQIVGIVGDTRYSIAESMQPMMYLPIFQGSPYLSLVLRSQHDATGFAIPVQKIIAGLDPDLPVSDVLTMEQLIGQSTTDARFNAALVLAFALVSLLLAAVGLYGVLSYMVTQRTSEIGIRLALGSPRAAVVRLMLLDGLKPAAFGLAIGLLGGVLATGVLRAMLYGTTPLDPVVFVAVTLLLALVACAACVLPSWRASRLDAMQALRSE